MVVDQLLDPDPPPAPQADAFALTDPSALTWRQRVDTPVRPLIVRLERFALVAERIEEKKLVEVACDVVAFTAVKFWRVEELIARIVLKAFEPVKVLLVYIFGMVVEP